jgi:DNA (cytosine-5)-methyltransferase 3A
MKPKYFLLENVKMEKKWEDIITNALGVKPILLNSSLVSGQNRERLYWTNIPNISEPKDKGILLSDIVKGGKGLGIRGRMVGKKYVPHTTTRKDGKSNCLVTGIHRTGKVLLKNGTVRNLTVTECEKLQTIPVGYTDVYGVSQSSKYKMIGNAWTVDIISHILKPITKKVVRSKTPN